MLNRLRSLGFRVPTAFNTRLRILGWYMLLIAAAMAFGLLLQRTILLNQLNDNINTALRQEVEELNRLASGRDPNTGEPFADDVGAIFRTFIGRNVPIAGEGVFTIVDGRPFVSSVAPAQLLQDPAIVEVWAAITEPTQAEIDSIAGPVRYLAVPVLNQEQAIAGVFVAAIFLDERRADVNSIVNVGAIVFGTTFIIATGLAWFASGRVLRPIGLLTATARTISDSNWTERIPVEGDDELAELATTFNDMLNRLEAAFSLQRRFIDDAGHELRTPITIIRGHLELLGSEDTDTPEVRRLVLDELDRMSRLVEDLLLLARSEQPDFLNLHPMDVAEFMDEIAAKTAPLSERDLVIAEQANIVIDADRQRLTQAMMNLIRNASAYTTPDSSITLGSAQDNGTIDLWVQDEGDGIPEEEQTRIFERFARGSIGQRRPEGAGLGLSIVRVIAEAHGGTVRLDSEPGYGSRFTLALPLTLLQAPPDEEEEEYWT